ncbi:MAG: MBL fold metallo-hydrolase [Promethearchaeia archaeon]
MILERLVVGPFGTNCYIFGSSKTNEVIVIDPGAEANSIEQKINNLGAKPIAVVLTHGHIDHVHKVGRILRRYHIPLMFNKKEYDSGVYPRKKADRWLSEGDQIDVGELTLKVLETPGHTPGSISLYCKKKMEINGRMYDGLIFTGDLLFRGSVGRTDLQGGNQNLLFKSIREKIMHNPELNDNFLVLPGHMGHTTIGEERRHNIFKRFFI